MPPKKSAKPKAAATAVVEEPSLLGKQKKPHHDDDDVPVPKPVIKKSKSPAATTTTTSTTSSSGGAGGAGHLDLAPLFTGSSGGEAAWSAILSPLLSSMPDADKFVGPDRAKTMIPVREMTFQALKPNPPARWSVVIFGEKPYPRIESATGISFFDADFDSWDDTRFGAVRSMKCLMKSALMAQDGATKSIPIDEIKARLKAKGVVRPSEWFQSLLTQGCLLINAAFTASSDDSLSAVAHANFWRPVVCVIIDEILKAKAAEQSGGVVFAWWGNHAKNVEAFVTDVLKRYEGRVPMKHVRANNPAARNDAFCDTQSLADINDALKSMKMAPIDWLPNEGWHHRAGGGGGGSEAMRLGSFIAETKELHKFFLDRLAGVQHEKVEDMTAINGINAMPLVPLKEAAQALHLVLPGIAAVVERSERFAESKPCAHLTAAQVAALYLYTCESAFYRRLNETLREANAMKLKPYFSVLRLLLSALALITPYTAQLYRGVKLDLSAQYPLNGVVAWWGVSSCTSNRRVAENFSGGSPQRTIFEVIPISAVSIREFSAFQGEEEFLLAPGTQLKVEKVTKSMGTITIVLRELDLPRLVG